jgi:hypothetical protein
MSQMSNLPGPGWYTDPRAFYRASAAARAARRRKIALVVFMVGVVSALAGAGLFVYGVSLPLIPEKSATARVVGEGLCSQAACGYTVVFTDASGARVTANVGATPDSLQVGSTTTIYYEVANPSYASVTSEDFGNGSNLAGLGAVGCLIGIPITVVGLVGLVEGWFTRRRRAVSQQRFGLRP